MPLDRVNNGSKIYCAVWRFLEKVLLRNSMPFFGQKITLFTKKQRQNVKNEYFLKTPPHSAVVNSVKWQKIFFIFVPPVEYFITNSLPVKEMCMKLLV